LAFTVSSFVYFGFVNSYSSTVFNHQNFVGQFHSGVYQYRILSAQLLLWIYDVLNGTNLDFGVLKLKSTNPEFDPKMFAAFYLLNTFFLVLTSIVMTLITESKLFLATNTEKILLVAVAVFSIAVTQFVVVPYDVSSYFFIMLFLWFFLKYWESRKTANLIALGCVMILSTLNRESSALCIALAAAVLFRKYGFRKESLVPVLVLTLVFMLTYLGLRFAGKSFTTNDGNLLIRNFTQPKNLLGMLFWLVFFVLSMMTARGKIQKQTIVLFHILALPYIFMCFYTGILYEARLYVPVFLGSIMLGRLETVEE